MGAYPIVAKQLRDIAKGKNPSEHRTHCCGMMALQEMGLGYPDLEELLKQPEDLDFIFGLSHLSLIIFDMVLLNL